MGLLPIMGPHGSRLVWLNVAAEAATWPQEYQEILLSLGLFWALPILLSSLLSSLLSLFRPPPTTLPTAHTSRLHVTKLSSREGLSAFLALLFLAAVAASGSFLPPSSPWASEVATWGPLLLFLGGVWLLHSLLRIIIAGTETPRKLPGPPAVVAGGVGGRIPAARGSFLHRVAVSLFALTGLSFGGLAAYRWLAAGSGSSSGASPPPEAHELVFWCTQGFLWLGLAVALDTPRRTGALTHSLAVREWMLVTFFSTTLLAGGGLFARDAGRPMTPAMTSALATWPLCLFLVDAVIRATVSLDPSSLPPPAPLPSPSRSPSPGAVTAAGAGAATAASAGTSADAVTGSDAVTSADAVTRATTETKRGASAAEEEREVDAVAPLPGVVAVHRESLWSQALFLWLNPLLLRGSLKHLTLKDCPQLAPEELSGASYERLTSRMSRHEDRLIRKMRRQEALLRAMEEKRRRREERLAAAAAARAARGSSSWLWWTRRGGGSVDGTGRGASVDGEGGLGPTSHTSPLTEPLLGDSSGGGTTTTASQTASGSAIGADGGRTGGVGLGADVPVAGDVQGQGRRRVSSLVWLVFSTFWWEISGMGILALLKTCFEYSGPVMLNLLVVHVASPGRSLAVGASLACLMLGVKVGEVLCDTHWRFEIQLTALKIRSALTGALFHKALRLSSLAKGVRAGKMANYLAEDVEVQYLACQPSTVPRQYLAVNPVCLSSGHPASLASCLPACVPSNSCWSGHCKGQGNHGNLPCLLRFAVCGCCAMFPSARPRRGLRASCGGSTTRGSSLCRWCWHSSSWSTR